MLFSEKYAGMSIQQINADFRARDDSHLWPINGRFNATERAIRRIRRSGLICDDSLSYAATLSEEISRIVNGEVG